MVTDEASIVALRREEMTATLLSYVTGQVPTALVVEEARKNSCRGIVGGWWGRCDKRERMDIIAAGRFLAGLLSNNDTPYAVYARTPVNF
ncbi:hypothetical protein CEXT_683981 [Caerostris extrusa]|uniref:Uncharacterized protein n=1 Tax=Caerostris extrusa TaxID=172846 RepID=A0AAV4VN38_CAEEX|nr:hypothetical protein CEXT_683981 [Caerostris extrusa]